MDPRGSSTMEDTGDHEGDGGGSEEDGALPVGDKEGKIVCGDVQEIDTDARCFYHLGNFAAPAKVSRSPTGLGAHVRL